MVNTKALMQAVKRSGLKISGIADKMGMSRASLYRKTHNVTDFTVSETEMFCRVVGVTTKAEKAEIFLPDRVT
jgi:DNA-binding phage protein